MTTQAQLSKKLAQHGIGITAHAAPIVINNDNTEEIIDILISEQFDESVVTEETITEVLTEIESTNTTQDTEPTHNSDIQASNSEDVEDNGKPKTSENTPDSAVNMEDSSVVHTNESTETLGLSGLSSVQEFTREQDGTVYIPDTDPVCGETAYERWSHVFDATLLDEIPESMSRDTSERDITIRNDITGDSRTTGTVSDFSKLFVDRYKRLRDILEPQMNGCIPIQRLEHRRGEEVPIIGIVTDTWISQNNNYMLELEDLSGVMRVVFTDDDDATEERMSKIVPDEVVGVIGTVSDDAGIIFGDELYFPNVPPMHSSRKANRNVEVALLSDLHFGAVDFAHEKWNEFVQWIRTDPDAENIEYILIAGDLVEGIGVYPNQDEELAIIDIYDQYELCGNALSQLPSNIDIISISGNHDSVRLAEPQPAISSEFTSSFPDNVTLVGNPSEVILEGVVFFLYHGMSLNSLNDTVPGLDIHTPTDAMQLMLEKRHVAPTYGKNVRIAPEHTDNLILNTIPDVLHTGHVHTFGVTKYRDVTSINSGCWQYQTDFQRKLNVEPTVGVVPVVNLQTMQTRTISF